MREDRLRGLRETLGTEDEIAAVRNAIAGHRWIFAKTYASFCPHEYTLRKEWTDDAEYRTLVYHVWKYGLEACYGKKTVPGRYWFDHENGWYYFVFPEDTDQEGNATEKACLINRARICDFDFRMDEKDGRIRCGRHKE